MTITDLIASVEHVFGQSKIVAGGVEVRFNCPICPRRGKTQDFKFHLYVNPAKGLFICHRCDTRGGIAGLLRRFGIDAKVTVGADDWDRTVWDLLNGDYSRSDNLEPSTIDYPESYQDIEQVPQAAWYMSHRGLGRGSQLYYKVGVVDVMGYPRIFLPTFNKEGLLIYYVTRSYLPDTPGPKYMNPKGISKSGVIFHWNKAQDMGEVIVCEGAISAMVAGVNAVATLGKGVTKRQIDMLVEADMKRYCIAFDRDALHETIKLADALHRRGLHVSIVTWPEQYNDPADLGTERFVNAMEQTQVYDGDLERARQLLGMRNG